MNAKDGRVEHIIDQAAAQNKNILIIAAPRSGSHALASVLLHQAPYLEYLGEIGQAQRSTEPWLEIQPMLDTRCVKLSHIVQGLAKIFLTTMVSEIKQHCVTVELRRRDKLQQFASWIYFRHIGAVYDFDHAGAHYLAPGSIEITMDDIENFLVEQVLDRAFCADVTVYYEDTDFSQSYIRRNRYQYPITNVIKNFDLAQRYLQHWCYHD